MARGVLATALVSGLAAGTAATVPASAATRVPGYTVLLHHWTIVSHKMINSGHKVWRVWSNAPGIDYRVQRVKYITDEECAGTDNSISGSLEVSFPVLEGSLGLSVERSFGWNNSHRISETIYLPRRAIGWPEWRWTWQIYKVVQKPWVCTERANTTRCSHFPKNWEPGSFIGMKKSRCTSSRIRSSASGAASASRRRDRPARSRSEPRGLSISRSPRGRIRSVWRR